MSDDDFKACPHCGYDVRVHRTKHGWWLQCENCPAQMGSDRAGEGYRHADDLREDWNRREGPR